MDQNHLVKTSNSHSSLQNVQMYSAKHVTTCADEAKCQKVKLDKDVVNLFDI